MGMQNLVMVDMEVGGMMTEGTTENVVALMDLDLATAAVAVVARIMEEVTLGAVTTKVVIEMITGAAMEAVTVITVEAMEDQM